MTRVVRLRQKGQLTIPEEIRTEWGLEPGAPLWLSVEEGIIALRMRDPRAARRFGEGTTAYAGSEAVVEEHDADASGGVPAPPRLRDLVAILSSGPRLTPEEADAFAADLAVIRAEQSRCEVTDPWAC